MHSTRTPATYRFRPPPRGLWNRVPSRDPFGCVVVRRITDDLGRAWRVREFRSHMGLGLLFRCDIPGVRSETRAASAPLESMDEDRLVDLLQSEGE